MKALSIQQPWAWAVVHAGKDIENRSWRTHHRGWVAIHSTAKPQREGSLPRGARRPRPNEIVRSAIIGVAYLTDVVERSRSKWFDGIAYGWVFEKPRRVRRPIPCKGRLGLWTLKPAVAAQITRQLGRLSEPTRANAGHAPSR